MKTRYFRVVSTNKKSGSNDLHQLKWPLSNLSQVEKYPTFYCKRSPRLLKIKL